MIYCLYNTQADSIAIAAKAESSRARNECIRWSRAAADQSYRRGLADSSVISIIVYLASALLCVGSKCYPALVGKDTPSGHFALHRRYVAAKGYGGDVMQFHETKTTIFAIHRIWLGRPSEHRQRRLTSGTAAERRYVTLGCINVQPDVYEQIVTADAVDIIN